MPERSPTVADCVRAAAEVMGVPVRDIMSDRRDRATARPRQIAMWVARRATIATTAVIGRVIGGRDHTTVIYGVRTIENLRAKLPAVRAASDRVLHRVMADDPRQIEFQL